MNIDKLEENLSQSLNKFSMEMQNKIDNAADQPLNEYDLDYLAREVFYTLNDFKDNIIQYLKDNK
ncbi:MAG: hypothetical protein LKH93_16305 [Clostridium beijerinckii]|jgi:hypothetical protein|nr:hypothetical protein [Clostridium beijerinckii]MCI1580447.1 hypothetical protein [Clostridium beijerinckii]MCI1584921.1 hypothetical protein [Clostridium beijerinckii]MCI1623746.1 hypothetical protein [Clostridium beijerinckii]